MKQNITAVLVRGHPSTITRKLSRYITTRGRTVGLSSAERAQKKAQPSHEEKPELIKFDSKLKETAAKMLIKKWSPELISDLEIVLSVTKFFTYRFGGSTCKQTKGK